MTERWQKVKTLFQEALETPEQARAAFLDEACSGDAALRREIESLLESHDASGDFLSQPPSSAAAAVVAQGEPASLEGRHLGPYRVLRRIGRGGTGAVYLAVRDDDEFSQRVAIKVVRRGMATAEILQRFRSERQILASIEHPSIARLLDGGSTDEGLPYFVMEYIEGEPIDRYCDGQCLGVAARLELFRKVCAAVQVAHQNLVVHRDLKPGNILVTADGTPKLLDFGIAKLLNPELSRGGHDPTVLELRVMTPDFASPEQIRGEAITTASDVYSLGVLLYLLLTGHRPYRLGDRPMREMEAIVAAIDVPRPSAIVAGADRGGPADAGDASPAPDEVARARSTTIDRLRRELAGDLDNIVGKALRKEPQRRYASVAQLAEDLSRYEGGLPVSARPDTLGYRAGKFVRRHRVPVAIAATAGVLGVVLAGALAIQAGRVAAARDRAETEAAKAHVVNEFLQEILGAADPLEGMGAAVTVVEAVEAAVPRIDQAFAAQPDVEAEVRLTIGQTFLRLGRLDEAEAQIRESLRIRRELYQGDHREIADSLNALGEVRYDEGDMDDAGSLFEESLGMRERLEGAGSAAVADSLDNLGNVHQEKGDAEEAERLYRQALAIRRRVFGAENKEVASSLNNVASVLHDRGELDEAERMYRDSLEMTRRVLGDEHPDVATGLNNLALLLHDRGDLAAAEPLYRESLEMTRRTLGEQHPTIAVSRVNLAYLLQDRGQLEEAERQLRQALQVIRDGPGDSHPLTVEVLSGIADLREEQGDFDGAADLYAEALEIRRRSLPADDPELALAVIDHGRSLGRLGRWSEVEPETRRAFELLRGDPDVEPRLVAVVAGQLAEMYDALGQSGQAAEMRRLAASLADGSTGQQPDAQ